MGMSASSLLWPHCAAKLSVSIRISDKPPRERGVGGQRNCPIARHRVRFSRIDQQDTGPGTGSSLILADFRQSAWRVS